MNSRFWMAAACAMAFAGSAAAQPAAEPRSMDKPFIDKDGNWLVDSTTLDPGMADTEGEIQSALGNCRLIATGGAAPKVIEGGPEKAEHGMIIVADADDSDSVAADTAADVAEAYGELYNAAVANTCDFS